MANLQNGIEQNKEQNVPLRKQTAVAPGDGIEHFVDRVIVGKKDFFQELNIRASVIIELRKFYKCSYDEFFVGLDVQEK